MINRVFADTREQSWRRSSRNEVRKDPMKHIRITFVHILLFSLVSIACHRSGPRSAASPAPPDTSYRVESLNLRTDSATEVIPVAFVKREFIQAAQVHPALGRYFLDEEYQSKPQGVAVMSHGLWRQRYKGDPQIIGTKVDLNGRPYTVIGVMPKSFKHPKEAEIWLPDETK